MDHSTALKQLNLTTLPCSLCNQHFPTYRILILKTSNKPRSYSQSQQQITTYTRRNRANSFSQPSQIYIQTFKTNVSENAQSKLSYVCLKCFNSHHLSLNQIHSQTYYDLSLRYIKDLPIPNHTPIIQCKSLLKQLQQQSKLIINNIIEKLDQVKFYILKYIKQTNKICDNYLDKIKYFEKLRINQRYLLQLQLSNLQNTPHQSNPQHSLKTKKLHQKLSSTYLFNQNQTLFTIFNKTHEINTLKTKLSSIKLTIPDLSPPIQHRKKKIPISDIPLSSMICFKGKPYFGTADGKIIYYVKQKLLSYKAHDSLIRSFSHDDQYTFYSGSDDFSIKAWDTHNDQIKLIRTFGVLQSNKSYHRNICVINSGSLLISTRGQYDSYKLRIWQLQNDYSNISSLSGHDSFIRSMVLINRNKDIIITGSDDKKLIIWDLKNLHPLKTLYTSKKIYNIIVSQTHQLCAIIDQISRISILDLLSYTVIMAWTMPRKILCSGGYSRNNTRNINNDYIIICVPSSLSIWQWNGIKIWSIDTQITFTPTMLMQVSNRIIASDGAGSIDQFYVGDINMIQDQFIANKNNQEIIL